MSLYYPEGRRIKGFNLGFYAQLLPNSANNSIYDITKRSMICQSLAQNHPDRGQIATWLAIVRSGGGSTLFRKRLDLVHQLSFVMLPVNV